MAKTSTGTVLFPLAGPRAGKALYSLVCELTCALFQLLLNANICACKQQTILEFEEVC